MEPGKSVLTRLAQQIDLLVHWSAEESVKLPVLVAAIVKLKIAIARTLAVFYRLVDC